MTLAIGSPRNGVFERRPAGPLQAAVLWPACADRRIRFSVGCNIDARRGHPLRRSESRRQVATTDARELLLQGLVTRPELSRATFAGMSLSSTSSSGANAEHPSDRHRQPPRCRIGFRYAVGGEKVALAQARDQRPARTRRRGVSAISGAVLPCPVRPPALRTRASRGLAVLWRQHREAECFAGIDVGLRNQP